MKRPPASDFSNALRLVRKARGFTQEDFDEITSRVYVSALERGIKQPTLRKVDDLANHLGVHPLTLLVLAYSREAKARDAFKLCEQVLAEIEAVVNEGG
jgi:transcriptional regulator with XRE-family HTH domain